MKETIVKKSIVIFLFLFVFCAMLSPISIAYTETSIRECSSEKEYLDEIAHNISLLNSNFTVTTTYEPAFTDLSIPEIIRVSRKYNSCFAGALEYISMENTVRDGKLYKTTFKVTYSFTETDYNKALEYCKKNFAPKVSTLNDYEKSKRALDYLVELSDTGGSFSNPINCFINKNGNQKAYALAYCILLDSCGVENEYVYVNGYHWNLVKIDDFYYNVDAYSSDKGVYADYDYFLGGKTNWKGYSGKEATARVQYNPEKPSYSVARTRIYSAITYVGWPLLIITDIGLVAFFTRKKKVI